MGRRFVAFVIILRFILVSGASPGSELDLFTAHPDAGINIIELVKKHGYPLERHQDIVTYDGYILEMHRIPYGRANSNQENRPAVLVMHGILSSSVDWVNMGPDRGLAYVLADAGYDVWLGNARGNTWSRKHIKYNPNKDRKFWDFSWHEIGVYDLPAKIDYIISRTKQEKIFYLGHSQGSAAFFVMASEKPKYNEHVRLATALAPIGYMSNVPSRFIRLIAQFETSLAWITKFLGMYEFLPHSKLMASFAQNFCQENNILQPICSNVLFIIAGLDTQLNKTMIPVILSNTPAGSSTKQFLHFAQEIKSGKFRKYDYGLVQNLARYGTPQPPDYDLRKITSPTALFYGANDVLASPKDVQKLARQLPHLIYNYKMKDDKFGHLDFLWAISAPTTLYKRIINLMDRF